MEDYYFLIQTSQSGGQINYNHSANNNSMTFMRGNQLIVDDFLRIIMVVELVSELLISLLIEMLGLEVYGGNK